MTSLYAMWSRAGVMFAQEPARQTPDLERLILTNAQAIPADSRLAGAAYSWLCRYHLLVAKHRLRRMLLGNDDIDRSILGLLLESVREQIGTDRFNAVIDLCQPAEVAVPLYQIHTGSETLSRLATKTASALSRKWGRWAPPFERCTKVALEVGPFSPSGVLPDDPERRSEDLVAHIIEELRTTPSAGQSELALARCCGVTRSAVRTALYELEVAGRIERPRTEYRAGVTLLAG